MWPGNRTPIKRTTPLRAKKPWRPKAKAWPSKATKATPRKAINKRGRRTDAWDRVWQWLKPRLESAGRTSCEFDFLVHDCWGRLDPAHSKKRTKMKGSDIYTVAMACQQAHDILDGVVIYEPWRGQEKERFNHDDMEQTVLQAIDRHGGLILP